MKTPRARHRAQEALLLEQRHRLADRCAADAERLAQLALVEADFLAMGVDVGIGDRLLQRGVGLVAEAGRDVERLQLERHRRRRFDRGGHRSVSGNPVEVPRWRRAGGSAPARRRSSASAPASVGPVPARRRPAARFPANACASRSCSIDILCAPTATAPSRRRSRSTRRRTPRRSPIALASSIIARQTARVSGSPAMTSSVASVSALIGLKHTLPQSLSQISSRMSSRIGASSPPATMISCRRCDPRAAPAVGLADRKLASMFMADDARRDDLRRRQHDAADRRLRTRAAATGRRPDRSSPASPRSAGRRERAKYQ